MMDKSPDRMSDCSAMTEDSYTTARFEGSDDDSMTKVSRCQHLYFSTVEEGEGDMTPQAFASEAENVCVADLAGPTDQKKSGSITDASVALTSQHNAVVKPSCLALDGCETDANYVNDCMVNNEHIGPSSDFLNTTCALELLDKASSTSASVTRSKLLRQSLFLKFDPLYKGIHTFEEPKLSVIKEVQPLPAQYEDMTVYPTDVRKRQDDSSGHITPPECPVSALGTTFATPNDLGGLEDGNVVDCCSMQEQIKKMTRRLEELSLENAELQERHERLLRKDRENQSALQEKERMIRQYSATVEEMKVAIEKDNAQQEDELKEKIREKDKVIEDLRSAESFASEVLKQMEKLREASSALKQNEHVLKAAAAALKEKLDLSEQRNERFGAYVDEQIKKMQSDKEELSKSRSNEMTALKAQCKKYEVLIRSYQEQSKQKTEQINSLISLCNELSAGKY